MVFIIIRGKSSVAIYNKIILYAYRTYTIETIKKTIKLNESFLIFFVIFVIYRYAMMIAG